MEVLNRPSNQKEMNSFIRKDDKQTNRDHNEQMMEKIYEPTGERITSKRAIFFLKSEPINERTNERTINRWTE